MQRLTSYLVDGWRDGEGEGATLYDPTNLEPVATASTRGLDLAAALAHARTVGAANLAKLTFVQRAALLKGMSKAIHAEREALIEIGRRNAGNTRGDAKFDIDGATGTLMYYAGLGASLGEQRVLLDGDIDTLGRAGTRLQVQHIRTPRPGVAIHINAFNFPCWGLAEKAACAILAGMPVLSKPATSTAWMTWHMVKAVVDAEILPPGVLSLLCGSVGDLLEHVEWGDVIAFTGSAATGHRIRSQASVLAAGTHVNVEADSLNSTVLGPKPKEETYDAFIRHVATELTQKAGQKCTATRRIFVPADMIDEVIEDLGERLDRMTVGDPGDEKTRVGPLSSAAQLESAKEGVAELSQEARIVYGEPFARTEGCFMAPTLMRNDAPHDAKIVHDLEVFGPISTIMPYDGSAADAAKLVRRGQGSLVASIFGDDRKYLSDAIVALAGWHGRLVITDAKVAEAAFAPGLVMPHVMHGGPGRAGGGGELGGMRGLGLYQQVTAVQGNGPLVGKLLDR